MTGLCFLADEDLDNDILQGVVRRLPTLDIVRVQDAGLSGAADPEVLEWAARQNRILLTHDVSTMLTHARNRLIAGQSLPGVFAISQAIPVGLAIDEIVLLVECSLENEWAGQIRFLPL
jgi:hypothetical protein